MKIELIVKEVGKFNDYVLIDKLKDKLYTAYFEFYGVPQLCVNDKIIVEEDILNRKSANYVMPCAFELLTDGCQVKSKDLAVAQIKDKEYKLKRVYG